MFNDPYVEFLITEHSRCDIFKKDTFYLERPLKINFMITVFKVITWYTGKPKTVFDRALPDPNLNGN